MYSGGSLFFIYHFNRGTDVVDPKLKLQKIHLFYVSGFLVFIIIELITGLCMGDARHSDILSYVSFAATLSSLIMSVVAIIFTIVSSSRGDAQYKKIDNASDKVTESLAKFSEKTQEIDGSLTTFKATTDYLSNHMDKIIEMVSGVDKTSKEVLDQLSRSQAAGTIESEAHNHTALRTLPEFIEISSYSGRLALYACVLSKDSGKPFFVKDISENQDDEAYKFGYIIASVAAGAISISLASNRNITVNSYLDVDLKQILEHNIEAFINQAPTDQDKAIQKKMFDDIKKAFS